MLRPFPAFIILQHTQLIINTIKSRDCRCITSNKKNNFHYPFEQETEVEADQYNNKEKSCGSGAHF